MTPGKKAARTRKRRAAGQKAARTRKLGAAGKKAARTRKLRTAGKKAARTRKRRTAGKKAAMTRKRRAAGRNAGGTRQRDRLHSGLDKLDSRIASGRLGRAEPWEGADIIISTSRPPITAPIAGPTGSATGIYA